MAVLIVYSEKGLCSIKKNISGIFADTDISATGSYRPIKLAKRYVGLGSNPKRLLWNGKVFMGVKGYSGTIVYQKECMLKLKHILKTVKT